MSVNKADLAEVFLTECQKLFSGFNVDMLGEAGREGPWTITIDEKPDFRMRFAFEETEGGPTFAIKEIFPGRGNAELLRGVVDLVFRFYKPAGFTELIIGTSAEDAAARQRFVDALCKITPKLQPAENGCVRALLN